MLKEHQKERSLGSGALGMLILSAFYFTCAQAGLEYVNDAAGRRLPVPKTLAGGIVTIGSSGPLRFLSLFDAFDQVIEVDKGDVTDSKNGRAYSYAYRYDSFQPHQYHPDNKLEAETVEKIGAKKPGLIIVQASVYQNHQKNCDLLAKNFPMIVIPEQEISYFWNEKFELADWYKETVRLIGTMLSKKEGAEQHIAQLNAIMADIRSLLGKSSKRSYVAGVTWQGSNELSTTFPTYLPLMLVDGINAHGGKQKARMVLDPEVVTGLAMDYFVIDPSSADKFATPNSQFILEWLYKGGHNKKRSKGIRLFVTLPMVWDSANYDCVLGGAYYLAHLLYNSLSLDGVKEKINTVFETFYGAKGKSVFEDMQLFFKAKSHSYGHELAPLQEVKIVYSQKRYSIKTL